MRFLSYILSLIFFAGHLNVGLCQQEERVADMHSVFFTVGDGLPSNELYDLESDSLGRLWICTDNGVSVFDGSNFKTIFPVDCSPVVLGVEKGPDGRLVFWTVKGEFFYINEFNLSIERIPQLDSTNKKRYGYGPITQLSFYESSGFVSTAGLCSRFSIDNYGNYNALAMVKRRKNLLQVHDNFGELWYDHQFGREPYTQIEFYQNGELVVRDSFKYMTTWAGKPIRAILVDKNIFIMLNRQIMKINRVTKEIVVKDFPYSFTPSLDIFEDSLLVIGTHTEGLLFLDFELNVKRTTAKNFTPTSFLMDQSGNFWFTTLENGLGMIMHQKLSLINTEINNYPTSMESQGDTLYSVNNDNSITVYYNLGQVWFKDLITLSKFSFSRVLKLNDEIGLYGDDDLIIHSGFSLSPNNTVFGERNGVHILNLDNGYSVYNDSTDYYEPVRVTPQPTSKSTKIRYSNVDHPIHNYFGSFYNSYYFNRDEKKMYLIDDQYGVDIRSAVHVKEDTFIVGTKRRGLLLMQRQNIVKQLFPKSGLSSIQGLAWHNEQLYIASNLGLYSVHKDFLSKNKLIHWNPILGFDNWPIKNIKSWNNKLVVTTTDKTIFFDPGEIKFQRTPPKIYNVSVSTAFDTIADFNSPIRLPVSQSKIEINPSVVHYSNKVKTRFKYRLAEHDTNWSYAASLPIVYNSLSPGEYTFELYAQNRFGVWSRSPFKILFSVHEPYYSTWWFTSLIVLVLFVIGLVFYRFQLGQYRQQSALKIKTIEAGNKALSLQLNPHFVFNSLNSVVTAISEDDTKGAIRFVSKLSRLMRGIFDRSQYQFVSIQEELESLKQYLELESLRLGKSLNYSITQSSTHNLSKYSIPPLILQPIIENAIWHGVLRLEDKPGKILIDIQEEKGSIIIRVCDNGPSIETTSAASKVKKNRISSLSLIRERFELLNQLNMGHWNLALKKRDEGGVEVTICIPKLLTDTNENTNN
ncbi:MAG: hypothetical protein CL840_08440 [Crocinitomicaceae bacterium]|nr:hypothetical protein [Crocinitomicaceae bacterium]